MRRRGRSNGRRLAVAVALCLVVVAGACTGGDVPSDIQNPSGDNFGGGKDIAAGAAAPKYGQDLDGELTIGLLLSSGGPGKDFQPLATGTLVVPSLVGGDKVTVVTEDDLGTAEGAQRAMQSLIDQGVEAVVYGSVGPQLASGIAVAAGQGIPVVVPYDGSPAVTSAGNVRSIALPNRDIPTKLVGFGTARRDYQRWAIVWDKTDPYAIGLQADTVATLADQGLAPVVQVDLAPEDAATSLRAKLKPIIDQNADAIMMLGDAAATFRVLTELNVLGAGSQVMVTPRAATPTLSSQDINALTPPVRNGTLSTGIGGGPWDPTPAVVNYYTQRNEAKGDSAADLSNADIISADAGLLIVAAAEKGRGTTAEAITQGFDDLTFDGIAAEYDFSRGNIGADIADYAVTAYIREVSAQDTYAGTAVPRRPPGRRLLGGRARHRRR